MNPVARRMAAIWRSARLRVINRRVRTGGESRDPDGVVMMDARAPIPADPEERETMLVVESADQDRDVNIKLRPHRMVLQRVPEAGWDRIVVEERTVVVLVNGLWIWIHQDGSVSRERDGGLTQIDADGAVVKTTESVEAAMSADGVELTRRTSSSLAAIREDGMVAKTRNGPGSRSD